MKKYVASLMAVSMLTFGIGMGPAKVFADSAPGDVIVSLGENLTETQKQSLMTEMNVPSNAITTTVSNQEEHQYLGGLVPKTKIGTRSISSSKITIGEKGTGISVVSKHIDWVTSDMYINALATAGVKDAQVYVTAPFDVSGTAALTGIIKAYEVSTGEKIPEDVKKVANEEMVTTAELGESLGKENATALMTAVKDELANNTPKTNEEMQQLVQAKADELNIPLSEQQTQDVAKVFDKMKELDISFSDISGQAEKVKQKLEDYMNSDEAKNFFQKAGQFVKDVFQAIVDFFSGLFNKDEKATQ